MLSFSSLSCCLFRFLRSRCSQTPYILIQFFSSPHLSALYFYALLFILCTDRSKINVYGVIFLRGHLMILISSGPWRVKLRTLSREPLPAAKDCSREPLPEAKDCSREPQRMDALEIHSEVDHFVLNCWSFLVHLLIVPNSINTRPLLINWIFFFGSLFLMVSDSWSYLILFLQDFISLFLFFLFWKLLPSFFSNLLIATFWKH